MDTVRYEPDRALLTEFIRGPAAPCRMESLDAWYERLVAETTAKVKRSMVKET